MEVFSSYKHLFFLLKKKIRTYTPQPLLTVYLAAYPFIGNYVYGKPSRKMRIIGITGTDGKSSTVIFAAKLLRAAGYKVGYFSSVSYSEGDEDKVNGFKMTMPGRFFLQRFLKKLVDNQCDIAIIEVTSEGVKQKRNLYIDFDIVLVTNINKEHIESHGGYEKYKEAKASVFKNLHMTFAKGLPKTIIVNNDNLEAKTFASYKADRYISFGSDSSSTLMVSDVVSDFTKSSFSLTCDKIPYQVCIPAGGPFVVDNAVAAMAVAYACDVPCDVSIKTLATLHNPPGRFEIVATNPYTIVDYAHTIAGVEKLLSFIQNHWDGEIVHVFGAAGGGRDTWKRPELAKLSETYTDISILTEENPFDESVLAIIDDIRAGFTSTRTVYREPHRRDAVKKGIEIARERKALLVLTAKGSETVIAGPSGKKYPYNEKETVICLINT